MNKTASLIIRILALAAAGAAGYAWYTIDSQNLKVAMENTKWLTSDDEIKAGEPFVARMQAMPKVNTLIGEKRAEITKLTEEKAQLNRDLEDRNKTIAEQKNTIQGLEAERADLIRKRDELKKQAQESEAKAASLQGELDKATEDLARKNEQIASMFSKEQYEEQVHATNDANDSRDKVVGRYVRLYNWVVKQGYTPPYNKNPLIEDPTTPEPKEGPEKISTQIIMIDRRNGLMVISLGAENNIMPGQIYNIERGGDVIGKARVSDIRPGLSIVSLLPGTQHQLLTRDGIIILTLAPKAVVPTEESTPAPTPVTAPANTTTPATETTPATTTEE